MISLKDDREVDVWVRAALTALATYPAPANMAVADAVVEGLRERLGLIEGVVVEAKGEGK